MARPLRTTSCWTPYLDRPFDYLTYLFLPETYYLRYLLTRFPPMLSSGLYNPNGANHLRTLWYIYYQYQH